MTLESLVEIHDGREGGDEISSKELSKVTRVRTYRAVCSSNWDGPDVVLAGCDASSTSDLTSIGPLGSLHPSAANCYLVKRQVKNMPKSKIWFTVTLTYSSDPIVSPGGNPANDPAEISWTTEQFTRPYEYDNNGKGVVNSMGQAFTPPCNDTDAYWVVNVKKNVTNIPTWLLNYRNSINSSPFRVDGIVVPTGCGWMKQISIGHIQYRETTAYRALTFSIATKSGKQLRAIVGGPTPWGVKTGPILDDWKKYILDQGNQVMIQGNPALPNYGKPMPALNADGTATRIKVPLDGTGNQLVNPTPANIVFIPFTLKITQPFSVLPLS